MVLLRSDKLGAIETGQKVGSASISVIPASDAIFNIGQSEFTLAGNVNIDDETPVNVADSAAITAINAVAAKLIAAPATEVLQAAISNKLPSSLGVKTSAQSISIVQASDSLHLRRQYATRIRLGTQVTTSGDTTIIAAPTSGIRIVICEYRIQNHTSTATTILLKNGTADASPLRIRCPNDGSGDSKEYSTGNEIRLSAATAFVTNSSAATSHGISVRYYLENATTGIPV